MTGSAPRSRMSLSTSSPADVTLIFDGGSLGNPGKGYGSFLVRGVVSTPQPVRLEYPGRTTNNEAEYLSLQHGLRRILIDLERDLRDPATTSVLVLSDSKLVVEQVSGRWKVRHEGLRPHHAEALKLLDRFGSWRLQWQPRVESVRLLGH
jgi:ribonuclease HI